MQPSIRYKRAIYGLFKVLFVAIKIGCRLKNSRELRIIYFAYYKYGIILSAYYTVLISIVFYSPLRERYLLYYNPEFMKRFPLLYACLSIFTCMAMLQAGRR